MQQIQNQTPLPTHLLIETTTQCNLRCKQCAHVIHKYDFADMELATFHKLRPLFPHAKEIALYGHGETFLHPQFFKMLAEVKQHPAFVYITTNGTLVTQKVAEKLVELQLDRLAFSLDAATPELFNDIRRGADLDKILDNIRFVNAFKKRAGRDDKPVLSMMYCAMKSNIQELPKLVRLADDLNMTHGVAVMNIYEYDEEMVGESLLRYPELAEPYLNEANRLAVQLAVPLGGVNNVFEGVKIRPVHLTMRERIFRTYREFKRSFDRQGLFKLKLSRLVQRLKNGTQPQTIGEKILPNGEKTNTSPAHKMIRVKKCRDPWEFLFLDVHGNIRVCCTSHRIMGNVNDTDIITIWNSPEYQKFRAKMLSPDIPEECTTCLRKEWILFPWPN